MKKILLAILLLVAFNVSAQTKYDHAIITLIPVNNIINISITGQPFQKVTLSKDMVQGTLDATPALQEIDKMQENGWELMESDYESNTYTFFLEGRKPNFHDRANLKNGYILCCSGFAIRKPL